jgi:hypothetical protein
MGKAPTTPQTAGEKTAEKGKSGEKTKEITAQRAAAAPAPREGKSKGHTAMPGHCFSWDCKAEAARYNFCLKHFDQFKFGLLKKTGEPVPDYEKKFEHYLAHQAKRSAQKVA